MAASISPVRDGPVEQITSDKSKKKPIGIARGTYLLSHGKGPTQTRLKIVTTLDRTQKPDDMGLIH